MWLIRYHPYITSAYFWTFSDPPTHSTTHHYVSTNTVLNISKKYHYLSPPSPFADVNNKGTPNLLNSSDNIDGTQTFLTQWSAVKLKSIEKRGKIQTTKMNKFSNLNICSTKREPNPQWPLTATIGLNFWSEVGSPIPMTSQWPQTAFARLLLICSLILDLSSTGLIKKRGTQCFKSRKREPYPYQAQMAEFEVTSFLIRLLELWSRMR